jgi:hypothetical protein
MTINTKIAIKNLKGEDIKTQDDNVLTLGEAVSNILLSDLTGGKMKFFVLAKRFFNEEILELDSADFSLVKKCVSESKAYSGNLIIGQIEEILSEIK